MAAFVGVPATEQQRVFAAPATTTSLALALRFVGVARTGVSSLARRSNEGTARSVETVRSRSRQWWTSGHGTHLRQKW